MVALATMLLPSCKPPTCWLLRLSSRVNTRRLDGPGTRGTFARLYIPVLRNHENKKLEGDGGGGVSFPTV